MKFLVVFFLAMLELWLAFPYGFKHGIPVLGLCAVAVTGSIFGICIIALVGDIWRQRVLRTFLGENYQRLQDWMRRRSPLGTGILSILASGLIGCSVSAALCISIGLPRRQVMLTCGFGAIFWALVWLSGILYLVK